MIFINRRKFINWLCLSGIIGLFFYILHDAVGSLYYPGYDRMSQAVSDLTSITAPSFQIANGFSSVYGLFACLCCALVSIIVQNKENKPVRLGIYLFSVMNWISGIGYSLFPLSESGYAGKFQDFMHLYVVTALVVVLSISSLILIAVGAFKRINGKPLAICAVIALLFMLLGAVGTGAAPASYFGLFERFSTYSAVTFNAILGFYGFMNLFGE